jgi:hypothetical protein
VVLSGGLSSGSTHEAVAAGLIAEPECRNLRPGGEPQNTRESRKSASPVTSPARETAQDAR